jgi:hypothetical protein
MIVYQEAYSKLISRGFTASIASIYAEGLATRIADADEGVDLDSNQSALKRPGTYTVCSKGGCSTYTVETTRHWYTTQDAETELDAADTLEGFGEGLHAYQDSFSHFRKLGGNTAGEIWDGHYSEEWRTVGCLLVHPCIDDFDPYADTEWGRIDKEMMDGTINEVDDFLEKTLTGGTPNLSSHRAEAQ